MFSGEKSELKPLLDDNDEFDDSEFNYVYQDGKVAHNKSLKLKFKTFVDKVKRLFKKNNNKYELLPLVDYIYESEKIINKEIINNNSINFCNYSAEYENQEKSIELIKSQGSSDKSMKLINQDFINYKSGIINTFYDANVYFSLIKLSFNSSTNKINIISYPQLNILNKNKIINSQIYFNSLTNNLIHKYYNILSNINFNHILINNFNFNLINHNINSTLFNNNNHNFKSLNNLFNNKLNYNINSKLFNNNYNFKSFNNIFNNYNFKSLNNLSNNNYNFKSLNNLFNNKLNYNIKSKLFNNFYQLINNYTSYNNNNNIFNKFLSYNILINVKYNKIFNIFYNKSNHIYIFYNKCNHIINNYLYYYYYLKLIYDLYNRLTIINKF